MKKYNLYINVKTEDGEKQITIVNSDLKSIEIYLSFCDDFMHLINTIKYTKSRKDELMGNIIFNQDSLELANYINDNVVFSNPITIDGNVAEFYKKDRDVVLATKADIINICNTINDEKKESIVIFLKAQLRINDNDDLYELINIVYQDYAKWISFTNYFKLIVGKKLISASNGKSIDNEYRDRYDISSEDNYTHEDHLSIYEQIRDKLLPYVKERKRKQKKESKFKEERKNDININDEKEKYENWLKQKEFEESIKEDTDDDYFDDFFGPEKANDERYHSIN